MVWPQLQEGNRDAYLYPSFELVPITVHDRHNNVVWPQLQGGNHAACFHTSFELVPIIVMT